MIRKLLALPFIYVFSRIVSFVGWIGGLTNPKHIFSLIFEMIIGTDEAEKMRNEHGKALVEAVEKKNIEYNRSKQELIEQTRGNYQESVSRISKGESVLSVTIALLAISVGELPPNLRLPFDVTLPIPSIDTILLILTIILVSSVFFRDVAMDTQAFTSPTVFDTYDELMTKLAWNGGALSQTRVGYNLLILQLIREIDERFYQVYLDMIADLIEDDEMSRIEALRRYGSDVTEIMKS